MKAFLYLIFLFSLTQSVLHACMGDERIEPSNRWKNAMDVAVHVPMFNLLRGQIITLHLPLEGGKSPWKIPQKGSNDEFRWYTETTATDQLLRIQALKPAPSIFEAEFTSGSTNARAMITLNVLATGVSPQFNPLYLTYTDHGKTFENHPHSPVVVRLETPKGKKGVWKFNDSKKESPKVEGMEFLFNASFESRDLVFEFIEEDSWNLFPTKAKFYITPMREIPTC
ncbi:hypothetical protein [Sulfuricurvum sp.]|uniref:hypothetical protein n=1 Tax=Sulfuricurvum sp. TaxID=2025608 RepID=UPI003BB52B54